MKTKNLVIGGIIILGAAGIGYAIYNATKISGDSENPVPVLSNVVITGLSASTSRSNVFQMVNISCNVVPQASQFYAEFRIKGTGGASPASVQLFQSGVAQQVQLWTAVGQYILLPAGVYQVQGKWGGEVTESGWVNLGYTVTLT